MIKLFKKICGLMGFKLVDKNLIKNDRLISKFTYHKINTLIDKLFSNGLIIFILKINFNKQI